MKLYLAGPLFSVAEREFNNHLTDMIHRIVPEFEFVLPQEYANDIAGQDEFLEKAFRNCLESIDEADGLLCILEGPDVDSGTGIEMGYAYALGKSVVGVRTDFRTSEDNGVNLMVSHVCTSMVWLPQPDLTMNKLLEELIPELRRVFGA